MRRFGLGRVVATPGALAALAGAHTAPSELLTRHVGGDWGEVDAHDRRENELGVREGFRVLSAYRLDREPGFVGAAGEPPAVRTKVWIITEADRSATTILLPEEY